MADNNKIQFDVELNEASLDASFSQIDKRAYRSAKESAETFETFFKQQERTLANTIKQHEAEVAASVGRSAEKSAQVFIESFQKQSKIARQLAIENQINQATGMGSIKKSAKESAAVFEEAFNQGLLKGPSPLDKLLNFNPVNALAGLYLVKQGVNALTSAVEGTFNAILEGEQKVRLEQRFTNIATQAGVAADVLKNDLDKAVKGLVDDDALLKLASDSFIRIGDNAAKLPTVLELARKTYKNFGGDIVANTEAIVSAVETGNKRQLRSIGLYTDIDKAVRQYLLTNNKRIELLSQEEIQQVRLNAILAEGKKRFGDLPEPTDGATEALKRLANSYKNVIDEAKILAGLALGPTIASIAESIASTLKGMSKNLEAQRSAEGSAAAIQRQIDFLQKFNTDAIKILQSGNKLGIALAGGEDALKKTIESRSAQIKAYQDKIKDFHKNEASAAKDAAAANAMARSEKTPEILKAEQDLQNKLKDMRQQEVNDALQTAQARFAATKSQADLENVTRLKEQQDVAAFWKARGDFEKFYRENGIKDAAAYAEGLALIDQQLKTKLATNQIENDKLLIESAQSRTLMIDNLWGMTATTLDSVQNKYVSTVEVLSRTTKELGKAFVSTFQNQATKALFAFAQGSMDASEAAQSLFTGILNAMAEMMINQGLGFMLQGAAFSWAGMPNGPQLVAAGAAMTAFGAGLAAISAANGGKANVSSVGGGSAGGGATGGTTDSGATSPIADTTAPETTVAQAPGTAINLTINGNILDRRQTGLEIAEVLREAFGEQGVTIGV